MDKSFSLADCSGFVSILLVKKQIVAGFSPTQQYMFVFLFLP
jgi:hypothetical protein